MLVVVRYFFDVFDVGMQDSAFKVLGEQQVTAATNVQNAFFAVSEDCQNLNQLIH